MKNMGSSWENLTIQLGLKGLSTYKVLSGQKTKKFKGFTRCLIKQNHFFQGTTENSKTQEISGFSRCAQTLYKATRQTLPTLQSDWLN